MAINVQGAKFVDKKGIEYILDYDPNGKLRPYIIGPLKVVTKTRNPYIIGGAIILIAVSSIGYYVWKKRKTKNQP